MAGSSGLSEAVGSCVEYACWKKLGMAQGCGAQRADAVA